MKVCQKKGCRKSARWPSKFCTVHGRGQEDIPVRVATRPEPQIPARPLAGYVRRFVLENQRTLKNISGICERVMKTLDSDSLVSGARRLEPFEDTALLPYLQTIVDEARTFVKFPLNSKTRIAQTSLVVAPPLNSRSTSYTRCKIHRDFHTLDVSGVYTFELFLDEITTENGSVEMWPKSKNCPHDKKNPKRGIQQLKLESETLVGERGTVFVWDSRILHRSLPNKSDTLRKTIVWMVSSESKPPIADV
jgi:hypothetical protein